MRIHRVWLRNYRGVIDTTVEFPTRGVTIIEGANEKGKTSIFESVDLILETLDSSQAKRIRDVRPAHRDEAPEVEVELSTGAYRFVYRKRWLRRPETNLTITEPRPERLTGRPAHHRVREILEETLDHELWRALRVEQWTVGDRQGENVIPSFNVRSLVDALDVAGGGNASGEGEDSLWRRICAERDKYWTPTGLVNRRRNEVRREVDDSAERVADLKRRLREVERDAARVADLRSEQRRLEAMRGECDRVQWELEDRTGEIGRLRGQVERLDNLRREAVARTDRILREHRRRSELVKAYDSRKAELAELEREARQAAPVIDAAIAHSRRAQTALEEARETLHVTEAGFRIARRDHEHHRLLIEYEQLRERRQKTIAARRKLRDAEAYLKSIAVDEDLLSRIEAAHLGVVRAEAAVQSAGARLGGKALSDITMRIDGEELTFRAGESIRQVVAKEMRWAIPGVAELLVQTGSDSRNLVAELNRIRDDFDRLCTSGGVAGLAEARRAAVDRKEAERSCEDAISAITHDLSDLTYDILEQKIEEIRLRVERYRAARSPDRPMPATYEEAKRVASNFKELFAERLGRYGSRQAAAADADRMRSEQEQRQATLGGRIENVRGALGETERLLALAREERPDSGLEEDLRLAREKAEDALCSVAEAQEKLNAADPQSLEILLDNAQAASRRAAEDLRRNQEEERDLRASLKIRGEEGLHTRLGDAQRRMRHIQRRHDRLEDRAMAARLLHAKFEARRRESQLRYRAPLTERIEELGRVVYGSGFEVELGDRLEAVRRTLEGVTLDVDQLSAGAREQLGLLGRLACAAIASPGGGGAPVMIDDGLGWSDPDRLFRMGAAIGVADTQCQIIILTCTPGRYAHVGNAKVIRIPA